MAIEALRSQHYKSAFRNLFSAGLRLDDEAYAVGHYLLGLAAECALRSVIADDPNINVAPHKLDLLFQKAVIKNPNIHYLADRIKMLQFMWNNTDRYRTRYEFSRRRIDMKLLRELNLHPRDLNQNEDLVLVKVRDLLKSNVLEVGKATKIYE